jgi:hypothetical protein
MPNGLAMIPNLLRYTPTVPYRLLSKTSDLMSPSHRLFSHLISLSWGPTAALAVFVVVLPVALQGQSVPPALVSPPAGPPQTGPHGEKLLGMPKFHDPAPYDLDEHTGYQRIFDSKSLNGWDADPSIWRVENGVLVGETFEGKPRATTTSSIARFHVP